MKKYKLIKEYPGSPKLGTEIEKRTIYADKWMFKRDCNLFPVTSGTPDDYPEFWEEVVEDTNPLKLELGKTYKIRYKFGTRPIEICKVDRFTRHGHPWSNSLRGIITDCYELIEEVIEKDYEILSFYYNDKTIVELREDGFYHYPNIKINSSTLTEEKALNNINWNIHSIKRLSDGEVFTIGDKVEDKKQFDFDTFGIITQIKFDKKDRVQLWIDSDGFYYISKCKKVKNSKNPLFRTEDDKDYEILSFKTPNNTSLMVGKTSQGWFTGVKEVGNNDFRSEEWLIKHNYLIESIRRLSDGEIFTVGDNTNKGIIKEFLFYNNCIHASCINNPTAYFSGNIDKLQHSKKLLLTTEDGVDIFEGDIFYMTVKPFNNKNKINVCKQIGTPYYKNWKPLNDELLFSTKEAAEEYILMNAPRLSINDVMSVAYNPVESRTSSSNKLKEIVKSKL